MLSDRHDVVVLGMPFRHETFDWWHFAGMESSTPITTIYSTAHLQDNRVVVLSL